MAENSETPKAESFTDIILKHDYSPRVEPNEYTIYSTSWRARKPFSAGGELKTQALCNTGVEWGRDGEIDFLLNSLSLVNSHVRTHAISPC